MAYISIIDLPELQVEQIKGKEYLLVTNSDLESNKLQMDNMTEYISEIVADKINLTIDDRLNEAINNAKVMVYDEGSEVGLANKINFIGATINSFINEEDMSIDVYVPSATVSSHFNTQDGATNAIIQKTQTELRYISKPSFDGAPFKIGDWQPGTIKKCIKSNIFYNIDDSVFIDKVSSFKIYIIQDNDTLDYLEFITTNGTFTSSNITAIVSNKTKELSHYKCNLSFSFNLKTLLKGRFKIKIEYVSTFDTYTFLEDEIFFDSDQDIATIITTASLNTTQNKFLSGVKYVGQGSTVLTSCTLKKSKSFTFPLNIADIDGSMCGLTSQTINFTDLGLTNFNYDSDIIFNKELSFLNNKFYNSNLVLKSRVNDWDKGTYVSTTFSELVDTNLDSSTRVYEDFVSETNRLNDIFQTFDSTLILDSNELQVYNSKLVYPQIDFSSFYENPNYSSLIGDRTYIRKFWHNNISHSNGLFNIISNISEEDLNTKIKIEISLDNINWFNCGLEYTGGVLNDKSGCRINSDTNSLNINNKIEFTLGLNKFTNSVSNWGIFVKITFLESAKNKYIDVLQITNW